MNSAEMGIVFINCTADTFTSTASGAISTWIWEICNAARRDGHEPWVISRSAAAPAWNWPNSILIDYPNLSKVRGAGRVYQLHRRLTGWGHVRQGKYVAKIADAIRANGFERSTLFLQNDIELAIYLRSHFPEAFIVHHAQNNNPADWRWRRRFRFSVNVAAAVTRFCADWNSRYYQLPVKTLLSGVDGKAFHPVDESDEQNVAVHGMVPVINFVGRTDHPKGPDILLRAALKLTERTTQFALQILGRNFYDRHQEDSYQRELSTLVESLEHRGVQVRRPGWITRGQLPDELRKAHIHCVPARWDEPFGLTTLEGMASGLATVASRTGGTPEVVGDGGLLFERESVDELETHLWLLVSDPQARRDWAKHARRRALELSWDSTWAHLKSLVGANESGD